MVSTPSCPVAEGLPGVRLGGSGQDGGWHGGLSVLGLRAVAGLFLFELEAARAVDLSAMQRDGLLVPFQEERGL